MTEESEFNFSQGQELFSLLHVATRTDGSTQLLNL